MTEAHSHVETAILIEIPAHCKVGCGRLGLDLTFRLLAAILKYDRPIPLSRGEKAKVAKGYYQSEATLVSEIKSKVGDSGKPLKVVECQIMDLADDIAYSTYDLEDSLKGGFLTPLEVVARLSEDPGLRSNILDEVKKAVASATEEDILAVLEAIFFDPEFRRPSKSKLSPLANVLEVYQQARNLGEDGYVRTAFTAALVGHFMAGVRCETKGAPPHLFRIYLDEEILLKVEVLKHVNYWLNIRSPRLQAVQYQGREVIKQIFLALSSGTGHELLPADVRRLHDNSSASEQIRIICDFIAGMTDRYAIEFYGRLFRGDQTIFKPF